MSNIKDLMIQNKKSVEEMLTKLEYPFSIQKAFIPVLVNSCKVEYHNAVGCFRIGYKLETKDLDIIEEYSIEEYGADNVKRKKNCVDVYGMYSSKNFKEFIEFVEGIEGIEVDIQNTHGYTGGKSIRGRVQRPNYEEVSPYTQLAKRVKFAVDTQDPGVLNRDIMDLIDGNITIAQSIAYKLGGSKYREHAVPCDLLYREAVVMYEEGAPLYEIANMFKNNLAIVLITPKEANLLDSTLNLKTEMPEGWKLGDSIFERFKFANIELELL